MQQVYWIKSSQTWTCPKAGVWKIVCVGGGASGGVTFYPNVSALQSTGGTTSFGSLLSAPGGTIESVCSIGVKSCGGYGGYDGMNYGGVSMMASRSTSGADTTFLSSAAGNGGMIGSPGLGYGAGGGVGRVYQISTKNGTQSNNSNIYAVPGKCGGMTMGIFDLVLNQSMSCTIGTSVKPSITASTLIQQFKKGSPNITEIADAAAAQVAAAVTAGTAGVIYIEFLG